MIKRHQLDQFKREFLVNKKERGRRASLIRSSKKKRGMRALLNLNLSDNASKGRNSLSSDGSDLSYFM